MRTIFCVILSGLYLLIAPGAVGQSSDYDRLTVIPPSPASQQFQRYGDHTVSHYTGVPDISIPIYTIKAGDITVPIYLSYHASGTQLDDLQYGNTIGLGWTLQAGGMVSRTVKGHPDEFASARATDGYPNYDNTYYEMRDIEEGFTDNEYDQYSFSFLGRSGKFMDILYGGGYKKFKLKYDQLKLEEGPLYSNPIVIKDESGLRYVFGETEVQTISSVAYPFGLVPNTWHLSGISSSRQATSVQFEYVTKQEGAQRHSSIYLFDEWSGIDLTDGGGQPINLQNVYKYSYINPTFSKNLSSPYSLNIYEKVIKRISFPTGWASFIYNIANTKLERIEIYNSENQLIQSVELQKGQFASGSGTVAAKTSKLQSVIFKDAAGNIFNRYDLSYYLENQLISNGKDHWGFVNGTATTGEDYKLSYNFLARQGSNRYVNVFIGGNADRSVSTYAAQQYMLKRMTYPTGGYSEFEYESNRDVNNQAVGGMRIKSIGNYTEDNKLAGKKEYAYQAGSLEVTPHANLYRKTSSVMNIKGDITLDWEVLRTHIYENSLLNLSPKGTSIGYQKVTETENDKTIEYYFDDQPAYEYEQLNYPGYSAYATDHKYTPFAHYYRPWNFGNLYRKKTIAPGYVEEELYNLSDIVLDTVNDLAFERVITKECGWDQYAPCYPASERSMVHAMAGFNMRNSSIYNFSKQYHLSGLKRMYSKTHAITNNDGRSVTTTTEYFYDNPTYPLQVSRQKVTDSKGNVVITNYIYATDSVSVPVYAKMVEQNRQDVIRQSVYENGNLISAKYTKFKDIGNNLVVPEYVAVTNKGTTFVTDQFKAYDGVGNIREFSQNQDVPVTFLWGYNNQFPVAKIIGAELTETLSLVGQAQIDAAINSGDPAALRNLLHLTLRSNLPNAQVFTYTYKPMLGMTSSTDATGRNIFYEYDAAGRLSLTKDDVGNIINRYCYSYSGQSVACGAYFGGDVSTLANWVPTGNKFCAPDANNNYLGFQAVEQRDINPNSATYNQTTNTYVYNPGECPINAIFYNDEQSQWFSPNITCTNLNTPASVKYRVPANTYSSTSSKNDANGLALADIAANGQNYANTTGACTPTYIAPRYEIAGIYDDGQSVSYVQVYYKLIASYEEDGSQPKNVSLTVPYSGRSNWYFGWPDTPSSEWQQYAGSAVFNHHSEVYLSNCLGYDCYTYLNFYVWEYDGTDWVYRLLPENEMYIYLYPSPDSRYETSEIPLLSTP